MYFWRISAGWEDWKNVLARNLADQCTNFILSERCIVPGDLSGKACSA